MVGRISSHRLDQLRNLAVDLEPSGCDFLELAGASSKPASHVHLRICAQQVNLQIISGLLEPEILIGDAAVEINLIL